MMLSCVRYQRAFITSGIKRGAVLSNVPFEMAKLPQASAGVYDRFFESMIEQSYGRLAFATDIQVDQTSPFRLRDSGQSFAFHHDQSIQYVEDTLGVQTDGSDYFLIHIHAPLYQSRSPLVRAS